MSRNDCFPDTRRACYAGTVVEIALHQSARRRMKEDRPVVPKVVEGALQFSTLAITRKRSGRRDAGKDRLQKTPAWRPLAQRPWSYAATPRQPHWAGGPRVGAR